MQRQLSFAIVDEVDSILIDEARTPLIISGPAEESTELYLRINELVPRLIRQKDRGGPGRLLGGREGQAGAPHRGRDTSTSSSLMAEAGLLREGESLYDPANIRLMHHLNAALRAHALYKRDVEYIVRNGEVIIVDEFTGRTMSAGAGPTACTRRSRPRKACKVREENQTVASITFQNYFRLYRKLSGMTGTADTEAPEFLQIYGLEVVVIPTHRPMVRKDNADLVYLTQKDKFEAIIEDIRDCVERGQPALVGTTSIETSEYLSGLLQKEDIAHQVLNAKQHEREAHIVAQAGRPGHRHHRHQHGRPRHRHRARRQPRGRAASAAGELDDDRARAAAHAPGSSATTQVVAAGRPAHHRHRAPRVAPHRQPAARPLGPPGRPGLEPLLPVDGRQPDAHLRRPGAHQAAAADGRHEGRRGHREQHADAPDREGAAQGRGAQLRHPQAAAAVRRRRQRPAQGRLPAAHRDHGHRGPVRRPSAASCEDVGHRAHRCTSAASMPPPRTGT